MLRKSFISLVITLSLSVACGVPEKQLSDLPIIISQPETQTVNIDRLIANAHNEVDKVLPRANLTFFSFVADCEALSELRGEMHLHFRQTQQTFLGERVFAARVVVDTIQQELSMKVQDETEQYLSTELLELSGISTVEIANALEKYLDSIDRCNDTVVLARATTTGPWGVRCGPPDKVFIECIEIDPETGDIKELR